MRRRWAKVGEEREEGVETEVAGVKEEAEGMQVEEVAGVEEEEEAMAVAMMMAVEVSLCTSTLIEQVRFGNKAVTPCVFCCLSACLARC
jgi:hypothetical protein